MIPAKIPSKMAFTPAVFAMMSPDFQRAMTRTAKGENSHITFPYREMRLPRGYVAHPSNTDRTELRASITVEFRGTPQGTLLVHMFSDGSIKTKEEMHREQNQRTEEQSRLSAEEARFPHLNQTVARREAYDKMMTRIGALRRHVTMSLMGKQLEKTNAETEYRSVLDAQQQERAKAAETSSKQSS